ncbi:ABC transporter substrate-binding protein [Streptomyces litchfieldiae]|uniref:ABC transporter substrate-binding protein n=1 Tax=Streptomyces litchfieldiae TaxID=3075543 RepID=A0ABU2MLL6_9ACTN|nr:ABC transporter substrate-binding protein [Streptomyces sp. DSM 44938]MDT0342501.1 ABC transporter substrate-binding protein [Streptomyces sp. DSM 44938]
MSMRSLSRGRAAGVSLALAGALILSACSSGGGGGNGEGNGEETAGPETMEAISFGDVEASTGPAEPIPGAEAGGTINVIQAASPAHLDPAQIFVSSQSNIARLLHRGLTTVYLDNDGNYSVIGDLATDSGQMSDDGRTWTYTLKEDVHFNDGTPITSADVRHTIERTFAEFITEGPQYIQQWLAGGADYRPLLPNGPYEGEHLPDTVLETPDERTVVFHFENPQPDLPYALAMVGYAMVSEEGDTQEAYDQDPVTSGPYQIEEFRPDRSMTLVRNEHWNPDTDAARTAYPDRWEITFGPEDADSTARLMADNGDDRYAISFNNGVDPGNAPEVASNPEYQERMVSGYQPFVATLAINMDRVTDKRVREAIALALPLNGILNAYGGSFGGEYASSLISPLLPGFEEGYDPYGKLENLRGDPEGARALLEEADAVGYELNYVHHTATEDARAAVVIEEALEEAGFEVNRSEVPETTWYDEIGVVDNGYDIYRSNWGHDWLSGSTVIPPQFDGRLIADGGNNYSHLNDEGVNAEIDRISAITDPAEAATEWFELNKTILEDHLPMVPLYYYKQNILHGSLVGGAVFNDDLGTVDMNRLYVIQE